MAGLSVSYSLCKLQQKQPAVFSRTHVVLPVTSTLLYEPGQHNPPPLTPSIIFILGFGLALIPKLWTQEQRHIYKPMMLLSRLTQECRVQRSCGGNYLSRGTWTGLGWLWEPAWIPQACWQAATLPSAGVCGAVLGGGWMCQRPMSGGLYERERHTGVFICGDVFVCACMYC